jgi:hypothetical protein
MLSCYSNSFRCKDAAGQRHSEDGRDSKIFFDAVAKVWKRGFDNGDGIRGLVWLEVREICVDLRYTSCHGFGGVEEVVEEERCGCAGRVSSCDAVGGLPGD